MMQSNQQNQDAVKGAQFISNKLDEAIQMIELYKQRYPVAGRELALALTNIQQGGLWLAAGVAAIPASYQETWRLG